MHQREGKLEGPVNGSEKGGKKEEKGVSDEEINHIKVQTVSSYINTEPAGKIPLENNPATQTQLQQHCFNLHILNFSVISVKKGLFNRRMTALKAQIYC